MDVEVVFPHVCGAFYQAYIQDLDTSNGRVLLSFPNDWKPSAWIDLGHVRFPPAPALPGQTPAVPLTTGTKVEALLPHHDNEPPGWWTGNLLKSKGELHVVEFQSGSDKYQDIVDHDKIRHPNNNPPLSKVKFYRKEFDVSPDLHEFCQRAKIHENFRARIRAILVQFVEDQHQLVVLADGESCLERASLLIEIHLKDLATHKALLTRNEMVVQRMSQQQNRQIEPGVFESRFHVPQDLVGLAIGRDGNNVNEARRMDGVISIEYDDYTHMFIVKGQNEEALRKAKEKLEFCRDVMMIPRNLAGKVIGKKGNIIQEILDKSKVINVRVVGDDEAQTRKIDTTSEVPFDFIGRRAAIENAKMMMEYHLDHLKDVENILQNRRELDSQFGHSFGIGGSGDMGAFFPRPSDRGSRRGGRGGGRGGRGGRQRMSSSGRRDEDEEEEEHPRSEEPPPPPAPAPQQQQQKEQTPTDEVYQSDDDNSDSSADVEEADGSGDDKSTPEDDEQGPDRRRPQRGGGGGGYRGGGPRRGGGGYRGGRGGSRGGRGYRNQRMGRGGGSGGGGGRGGQHQQGQSAPETSRGGGTEGGGANASGGDGSGTNQPAASSAGQQNQNGSQNQPLPKPQRRGGAGRRGAGGGRGNGRGRSGGAGGGTTQEPKGETNAPPPQEGSA